MFRKNKGSNEHEILQNQFTAYLSAAVRNARIDFLRAKITRLKWEQSTDEIEFAFMQREFEMDLALENAVLLQAIKSIKERERYVFLSRVLEDKKFKDIAHELDMREKGAAALYYRTIRKLRGILEGGESNEF